MALTNGFVTTAGTTARDARQMELGRITRNQDNTPRPGQLYGDSNAVKSTSSMSVTLLGDTSWALTRGKSDGVVIITNDGDVQVALDPAPSANSRYDVVYLKQNDTEKGDANSQPVVGKVTGTAAASPTVPAVPSGALLLATVLVPAGVTATNASGVVVNNLVKFTALNGAAIRYRAFSDMLSDTNTCIDGTPAFIKGSGQYYLRAGVWRRTDAVNFTLIVARGVAIGSGSSVATLGTNPQTYQVTDTQYFDVRSDGVAMAKQTGWYEVTANVSWSGNSNGERYVELMVNDSGVTPEAADRRSASGTSNQSVTGHLYCNSGEFIKLKGWQNSGSTINYSSRVVIKPLNP